MATVPNKCLRILRPYLETSADDLSGEVGMHCPFHDDRNRSSSLNIDKDLWFCQVCSIGMSSEELVSKMRSDPTAVLPPPPPGSRSRSNGRSRSSAPAELPDEGTIAGWHSSLLSSRKLLKKFQRLRGLSVDTLARFQIGYDEQTRAFTIPVRDYDGNIINVRRYQPDPQDGRRKIWSVRGHGEPALYPIEVLDESQEILLCEGEWDALLANQLGFAAITRTGTADTWKSSWNNMFKGKDVWICHDMDTKGQKANGQMARELRGFASDVVIVKLPYETDKKHGKDLTDYFHVDGHTAEDFVELIDDAMPRSEDTNSTSVLDSFDSGQTGKPLSMRVTVTGKRYPTYLVPKTVTLSCNMKAGKKCDFCPMQEEHEGEWEITIDRKDPIILKMVGFTDQQLLDAYRERFSIQKCTLLKMDRTEETSVEELYVRPAIDQFQHDPSASDYTNRKILSVGRHDSQPNNTVKVRGSIYPNPRSQHNEFLAHDVTQTDTVIDTYQLTDTGIELMKIFQTEGDPLRKLRSVADDLSMHVTKIYGRPEMHALMDLVWHSMTNFKFLGDVVPKGWLDVLIIGDTRTGKSEVASRIASHYGAGEMVSCEAASFAGIVGGLQQMGNKEWEISWGAIPLNDRRLVVLDEVSGLTHEQISQMSSIRSSGVAELIKIRQERTLARTRILWLSNPRDGGRLASYAHGIHAVRPLIGNMEDIARFDLAMAVAAEEVRSQDINREHVDTRRHAYPRDACTHLVQWVWSRKPEQCVWAPGAEELVLELAVEMGDRYIEDPPLVQAANVRFKIARVAVAIAARTFSTTDDYQSVYVEERHVEAAFKFMNKLYAMESFGYLEHSTEKIEDNRDALRRWGEAKMWLADQPVLVRFLRTSETGVFKSNDMQDFMNLSRDGANGIVSTLFNHRLVARKGAYIEITPMLQSMLRDIHKDQKKQQEG